MSQKWKKSDNTEGSVKIVGINHGLCLQKFLSRDGWKEEKFTDVVFMCTPHSSSNDPIIQPQRNLRANRSVLAAASLFFASLLPDCQQEEDFTITVEYSYEEMFSILEYIYSGRLVSSIEKRERILSILNELKINTAAQEPIQVQPSNDDEIEETYSIPQITTSVEQVEYGDRGNIKETRTENVLVKQKNMKQSNEPEVTRFPCQGLKMYPSKKNLRKTTPCTTSKSLFLSGKAVQRTPSGNPQPNDFTLMAPYEKEVLCTEALQQSQELGKHTGVEQSILKSVQTPSDFSQCNLSVYLSHTWCYGVYSPYSVQTICAKNVIDTSKETSAKQTPHHVPNLNPQPLNSVIQSTAPFRNFSENVTEAVNSRNGNTNVLERSPVISRRSLPKYKSTMNNQYAFTKSQHGVNMRNAFMEKDSDNTDMALAKHFLQEEVRSRHKLHMRIRMLTEKLSQYKDVARSILLTKTKLEMRITKSEPAKPSNSSKSRKPQTQCEQCGKMVLASRLHIHRKIHSGIKSHLCDLCGRAFLLKAYLNAHIRVNHRGLERPKRFMCSSCGYTCDQRHKLEVHERIHTDERPFQCQFCDKKFREKGTLVRHIRTHTGEKPYACEICGTAYAARDTYVQHYRRKHARTEAASEQRQRMKSSNGILYRCDTCDKTFFRRLAFEKHRSTHTGIAASIRCNQPECSFTYSSMAQLKDHMSLIHPEKTYACPTCSKVFLSKQNLTYHQSKHDPSRGYHCSFCPTSLTTKASLLAHEKIHTRDTPFECSVCNAKFHSAYIMKIHQRKHQPSSHGKKRRSKQSVENMSEDCNVDARSNANYF